MSESMDITSTFVVVDKTLSAETTAVTGMLFVTPGQGTENREQPERAG